MNRKLFVGNLPYSLTEQDLAAHFAHVGTVEKVALISDRETGKPRGFGFVTMATEDDAAAAVERLDGSSLGGRSITVNVAREQQPRDGNGYHNKRRDRERDHRGGREARW